MKENHWLATIGYMTMQRLMVTDGYAPMAFDALSSEAQAAWMAAAAAIRRRVVAWSLTGEEGQETPFGGMPPVVIPVGALQRAWAALPFQERLTVLAEMLTPAERRALRMGLGGLPQEETCTPSCGVQSQER